MGPSPSRFECEMAKDQGLLNARHHSKQHVAEDAVGSPQTEVEEHRLQNEAVVCKILTRQRKWRQLEGAEIAAPRPARHRFLDLARNDESDKHDGDQEFLVVFDDEQHDEFYEQNFKKKKT